MCQSPPTSFRSFQNSQNVAPQAASPWHLESWLRGCAGAVPSLAQRSARSFPTSSSFGGNHRFNEIQIGMEDQTWHLVFDHNSGSHGPVRSRIYMDLLYDLPILKGYLFHSYVTNSQIAEAAPRHPHSHTANFLSPSGEKTGYNSTTLHSWFACSIPTTCMNMHELPTIDYLISC